MLSGVRNPFPMPTHLMAPRTQFHRCFYLHFAGVKAGTEQLEQLPQTMQHVEDSRTQLADSKASSPHLCNFLPLPQRADEKTESQRGEATWQSCTANR